MRFFILCYHPNHIKETDLEEIAREIRRIEKVQVYTLAHYNNNFAPMYLIDSETTEIKKHE